MALGTDYANKLLLHVFQNADIATIGDASGLLGSATAGSFYLALHTADPSSGTQATSEATYTSYARVAVARTSGGWTVSTNTATNAAEILFPQCTGGTNTITHMSVGAASSGTGLILYVDELASSLAVSNNVTPRFIAGAVDFTATTGA